MNWYWIVGILIVVGLYIATRVGKGSKVQVDKARAEQLLKEGARLVDVRSPAEFQQGHLEAAINIPVQQLNSQLKQLEPKDKPVVVYCASGMRSASAASMLRSAGFSEVIDIANMAGWPLRP